MRRVIVGVVALALIALIAWAYSYVSPMTPRASREWSRGRVIGRTPVSRPVALRPAPDEGVLLIWPNPEGRLELAHIGADGEVLLNRVLPVGAETARDPQLQVGLDGRLHLLWREMEEPHAAIHYVMLSADGTSVGQPQVLSDPTRWAEGAPRLALDPAGRLHALWADEVGIQWAMLSAEGTLLEGPVLLVPEGRFPAVQVDNHRQLHLAWQQWIGRNTRGIYYSVFDPESGETSEPEEIALVFQRTGQRIEGPTLGLDAETGYVLWSALDVREVSSRGQYAFFPLDLPGQKRINALRLEEGRNPSGMHALEGQRTPLLVALSETVGEGWEAEPQIAVVAVAQGRMPEYEVWGLARATNGGRRAFPVLAQQAVGPPRELEPVTQEWEAEHVVTASNLPSVKPVLVIDDRSYLHLTWLEPGGFDQYRVIYASTAPDVMRAYNALTLWDVVDPVFRHVFRLSLVVLVSGPMLVLWALVPFGGLVLYHLITGEEDLDTTRPRLVLGAALALEVALTFCFPPRVVVVWPPLRWVAPVVTAALATAVTARMLRHRGDSPLFAWFFMFTGIHSLLLLAIYFLI